MNNINILFSPLSITSILTQPEQTNIPTLNNFQNLVNKLLKKDNEIEIYNILYHLNTNPKILKSVYEAITTLNIYGQLNDITALNNSDLENNKIINYILNNNNLKSEERQIVLNSIKIISEHITKNGHTFSAPVNLENYKNLNQQVNLSTQDENLPINNMALNSNFKNRTVNSVIVENNNISNNTNNNNIINQTNTSNLDRNQRIQTIQLSSSLDNSIKTINNEYMNNPVNNNSIDKTIVKTNLSQDIDIIGNNLKINIPDSNINLKNLIKIKNHVSNIFDLLSNISNDKNNKTLHDEITNLKNYVSELNNIIDKFSAQNINDGEQFKNISTEISKIINSIFISMMNAVANLYNYQKNYNEYGQQNTVNPIDRFIKNNNYIMQDVTQNNRKIFIAENKNIDLLKELISKIFLMLKEMNAELYISKKIEYVYKPTSSQSSQVTPDGILLINTANLKNFREFVDIYVSHIIDNKDFSNSILVSKNIISQASQMSDSLNVKDAIKPIISNPVSITYNYDVPKTFNIAKDNISQFLINTINKNYYSNLKSVVDEINTYFVNFIENKSEQRVIDAKVFEKILDYSGKVRDDFIIKQIVKNISDAVNFKITEITEVKMMLRPENLGPVIVKFETKDNVIIGRIDVATTITRDILKANIIELKNSLNNLGYNVNSFEVSILNAYTSNNQNSNLNYYNRQEYLFPIHINNETIEDIGVIAGTDSYLNFLA